MRNNVSYMDHFIVNMYCVARAFFTAFAESTEKNKKKQTGSRTPVSAFLEKVGFFR